MGRVSWLQFCRDDVSEWATGLLRYDHTSRVWIAVLFGNGTWRICIIWMRAAELDMVSQGYVWKVARVKKGSVFDELA